MSPRTGASASRAWARRRRPLQFLAERPDFAPAGGRAVITGVTARSRSRPRSIDISNIAWFDDPVALATSPDIDLFVELVGGSDGPPRRRSRRR